MGATRRKNRIRLACMECDRDDFDYITDAQLESLQSSWEDITRVQTLTEAERVWTEEQLQQSPWERSNLEWFTHMGTCPECIAAGDEYHERIAARNAKQATLF